MSAPTVLTRLAQIAEQSKHELRLWAATCHAPELETARVTRFTAGADEPYEGILHVRICGGRRGQPRLLPGSAPNGGPSRLQSARLVAAVAELLGRSVKDDTL